VHIRCCGNGCLWFRSYSGSLLKSAKVSKTLLPHHSAPRLGSVCPHSGFGPWAAAMGHPWPSAANPASCRVTHAPKPAFGQRGLTGRPRSRSRSKSRSKARAQRPTGRLECGEATATARSESGTVKCGSWPACDSINWVYLMHRVVCIAGKPAPTEKQSHTARSSCRAPARLRAFDLDLLLILICGPRQPRWPQAGTVERVNRQGCRFSRAGPWMARRGGPRSRAGVRACRA
jgi:hypothetical protein